MANHDTTEAETTIPAVAELETASSYCCECGTYDAHKARCLCCGFDFRIGSEAGTAE